MLRIVLIRPGATDYDREGRIQGTLDIPLSDEGGQEVSELAGQLAGCGIEIIYAPNCQPARQTAEVIARGLGVKFKRLERMQNLNHGLWQGMQIDEVRQKQPRVYKQWQEQPENVCPPEGEMLSEADARVRAAMARLLKKHREGTIALVVPEPLASLVRRFVNHADLGNLWNMAHEHGHWEVLEVEPRDVTVPAG
ncbi:MAG: histidine phosphatase family protein [Thermoguttaceae bacterium]|jgi:probable phosphoglycerate mutase|nr:histidine phosphatase family protein [Thermoguttaceae bacterium]